MSTKQEPRDDGLIRRGPGISGLYTTPAPHISTPQRVAAALLWGLVRIVTVVSLVPALVVIPVEITRPIVGAL